MSFLPAPPKQLYFGCLQPSKSTGGETALADFRKVFRDVPLELRQKLLDKGIRYTRSHKRVGTRFTFDVADMLGWPQLFGTDDKAQVEAMCKAEGITVEWDKDDTFVNVTQSQAFQLHPITHEHVWFNHIQVFHWTTFAAELWYAFQRTREWKLLLHCLLVGIFSIVKYGILGHKMSLHCEFGDGEPIRSGEMSAIRSAIHNNMVFNRWQKGDICMIDNFSTSHGRQPTYDTGRKIAVAWADPLSKANAVTSLEPVILQKHQQRQEEEETSYCQENPQEKTPESTLTKEDSKALLLDKESFYAKKLEQHIQKAFPFPTEDNPQDMSDAAFHNLKSLFHEVKQSKMHHRSLSQPAFT